MFDENYFLKLKKIILRYFYLTAFFCVLGQCFLEAQTAQIQHKYYSLEDGLPGRTIHHITQDSIGYIWLATNKGICKFNGYTFETYNKQHGLRFEDIKGIYVISNEIFWIKYNLQDYNCFDVFNTKTLTTIPFAAYYKNQLPSNLITNLNSVVKENNNSFFLGLNDTTGFIRFINNRFTFVNWPYKLLLLNADENANVYALEVRKKRMLKFSKDLQLIDTTLNLSYTKKLLSKFFFPYSTNNFTYRESINTVNVKKENLLHPQLKNSETNFFCSFLNNKKYFINDHGIYNTTTAQEVFNFSQIDKSVKTPNNPIHSKYISPNGTVWIGLEFGLLQINLVQKKFNTLLHNVQKQDKTIAVRGIIENSQKKLYIHTENLVRYKVQFNKEKEVISTKELASNEFNYAFANDNWGNVFFIDNKLSNVNKVDSNGNTKVLFKCNFRSWVWGMSFINSDVIWAGTEGQGIHAVNLQLQTTQPINYNQFQEIKGGIIYQIKKINDSCIFICTSTGLYKATVAKGIIERYCIEGKGKFYLPTNNISFIETNDTKILWIATLDYGLLKFNQDKGFEKAFTKKQGLPTETIYAAYKDAYESIWMPSDKGIIQFNEKLQDISRLYTTKDGITNNEFNRIAHYKASDGILFFGGLNGVTYFNPKEFSSNNTASKFSLVIEEAKIYNGTTGNFLHVEDNILNKELIKLNAYDRFINLQLALLAFSNVDKIQYAYKLDNDSNWTFQNNRIIQIAGLAWGKHTITIKAKDENGVWANNTIIIHLHQLKPFYLQAWFFISLLLAVMIIFFIVYKYRLRKIEQQKIALTKMVSQRTEELNESKNELSILLQQKEVLLKEIHHRVKNNLTVISSLLELQSDITLDENAKATLLQGTNRVRSIALIHQKLYQHQNFASIELHEFINDLYKQIESVMYHTSIPITFINNVSNVFIDIDTSVPLGLIVNELVTNSFKYAFIHNQNPFIQINLNKLSQHSFELIYIDNGKGLPANFKVEEATSLGMQLMHMLSNQLSGNLVYQRSNDLSIFTTTFKTTEARNKE